VGPGASSGEVTVRYPRAFALIFPVPLQTMDWAMKATTPPQVPFHADAVMTPDELIVTLRNSGKRMMTIFCPVSVPLLPVAP
jgi:hypothetical protein